MDAHVKDVVREMSKASDEGRITFPAVVKALMEVGIGRYHADLVVGRKTYYLPGGDFEEVEVHEVGAAAPGFSADGVKRAVRAIQRQGIGYREFCRRIAGAGCVGYFVSLAGRRVVYYGRTATSMSNGSRAPSHDRLTAFTRPHSPKDQCNVRPHRPAHRSVRRHDRLL
jgi:uncharacterized protein YbcV (DUF1398 family)